MSDAADSYRGSLLPRSGAALPHAAGRAPLGLTFIEDPQEAANGQFDLLQLWNTVLKWKWLILGMLLAGLALGAALSVLTTPVYRATTTVQIEQEPAKVTAVESQRPAESSRAEEFYRTQYALLRSEALARRVVADVGLADDPKFLPEGARAGRSAAQRAEAATRRVAAGLRVEPIEGSRIVAISYESADPAMAARIANAFADNYIDWNLARRFEASAAAREFLQERLEQTRRALEEAQRRANDYAQANQLITVGGDVSSSAGQPATGESLAAADLVTVNQNLAQATAQRIQAEQRWRQAQRAPDMALPEVLSSQAILAIKAARDTAWAEYQQNLRTFKPDYPSMVAAKARIDTLDQQLAAEVGAIRSSLQAQYEIARNNEAQLRGEVARRKAELLDSQGKRVGQSLINTDIETTKALYDGMLATYKEIGIAGGVGENNIAVVDEAKRPDSPIRPRPALNLAVFGAIGLALGALVALLLDRLDLTIKVPEDVEKDLHLPLLGAIPTPEGRAPAHKTLEDPKSQLSEAYHSVRTALQFATEDGVPSSLLVTSARPGEGKTTSSLAIAMGLARLGNRVLLVDADMRDPTLHRLLSRDNGVGLSNLLAGGVAPAPALQPTGYENLTFLACGPLPPNPAELLGGGKMRQFLGRAQDEFDVVVIDGPPVMGLADAPQLANLVAGVMFVVEPNRTKRDLARAAIHRIRAARGRIVGAVLTKFDMRKAGYAYGHAYGYGYGYGYGFDYGARPQRVPRGLLPRLRAGRARA